MKSAEISWIWKCFSQH